MSAMDRLVRCMPPPYCPASSGVSSIARRGTQPRRGVLAHASLLAQAAELLAALQVVEDYISREDGTRSDERFEVLYVTRAAIAKALR